MVRQDQETNTNTDAHDYYAYLNLRCDATTAEIKHNYRQLALQWHPDKQRDANACAQATEIFRHITAAYETLMDASQRKVYDVIWKQCFQGRSQVPQWADSAGQRKPGSSGPTIQASASVADMRRQSTPCKDMKERKKGRRLSEPKKAACSRTSDGTSSNGGDRKTSTSRVNSAKKTVDHEAWHCLPPICSELIVEGNQGLFMAGADRLDAFRAGNTKQFQKHLHLIGPSGQKMMSACLLNTPSGDQCLSLSLADCEMDPCACIFASADGLSAHKSVFDIVGSLGKHYGDFVRRSGRDSLVRHGKQGPVLRIQTIGHANLHVVASTVEWNYVASASLGSAVVPQHGLRDVWKVQVKPGYDAVLIISAMLAQLSMHTACSKLQLPRDSSSRDCVQEP